MRVREDEGVGESEAVSVKMRTVCMTGESEVVLCEGEDCMYDW